VTIDLIIVVLTMWAKSLENNTDKRHMQVSSKKLNDRLTKTNGNRQKAVIKV